MTDGRVNPDKTLENSGSPDLGPFTTTFLNLR
jgi:hypothetical protein